MTEIVLFLGNPGEQYRRTRHNAARMVLEKLPGAGELRWQEKFTRGRADVCRARFEDRSLQLVVPLVFMNESGETALAVATFFKVRPRAMLVVHDEIELPFGTIGFRKGGGLSGHNGLRSIADRLGSSDFCRFRIGVGRPGADDRRSVADYVLARFSPDEEEQLEEMFRRAATSLVETFAMGAEEAEQKFRRLELL